MTFKSFFILGNRSRKAKKKWFMTREKTNEVEDEEYPQTDLVCVCENITIGSIF